MKETSFTESRLPAMSWSKLSGIAPLAYRRPALFALAAICAGVILGQYDLLSPWLWLVTAILALLVAGVLLFGATSSRAKVIAVVTLTLLGLLSLMAFRVSAAGSGLSKNHILSSVGDGAQYRIYGLISDWPDVRERSTRLTLRVDSTAQMVAPERYAKSVRRSGSIMVFINTQSTDFQYGDRIALDGVIAEAPEKKNPGGFDYARYLRWKDIFGIVYLPHQFGITRNPEIGYSVGGVTRLVREYILTIFDETLQEQPAALASGFLIGETAGIDDEIYQQFRRSGTLHLLAVSGSNVAVALLVLRLFLWPFPLGRRMRYLLLILGAVFFSFLSHNDPSVVRASVMVTLFLMGRSFERRIDYHNLIASAGAIILFWSPNQLFDVGFQLSFAVSWALILFVPPVNRFLDRRQVSRAYKFFLLPMVFAFVAQLSSSPIALYYFGTTPLNATLSNLIVAPAVGGAVALSLVTLGAASVLPLLGSLVGAVLNLWLKGILVLLQYFGGADSWQLRAGDFSVLSVIVALTLVALLGMSLTSRRLRRVTVFALVLAPVILIAPSILGHSQSSSKTTILASRGGICAVVGGSTPTLIISDLVSAPGQQFRYVLAPALHLAGANTGSGQELHLAQLSADHQTLVNALTVCDSFPGAALTLTKDAEFLWRDHQAQYGIPNEKYHLRFSSGIDSALLVAVLEHETAGEKRETSLIAGSSLALQVFEKVRILYLSLAVDELEFHLVTKLLRLHPATDGLSQSETTLVVVVDKLDARTSAMLQKLSKTMKLRIITSRRNRSLQLSADFAQLVSYVSVTGAVTIVGR